MKSKAPLRFGFFFLSLAACHLSPARAAFEEKPPSARGAALGEAMTGVTGDANSVYYNPAGLRFSQHRELLTSYSQLFSITDLPYEYFGVTMPTAKAGSWAVSYSQFGPTTYQEREIAVTQSVLLAPEASFGYTVKQSMIDLRRYGGASALGLDAGFVGQLHPKVKAGIAVRNLNHPNFGNSPDGPQQQFRAGVAFRPVPGFLTSVDAVKPANADLSYRAGEEVQLAPVLAVRFGVETAPNRYTAGFGLRLKTIRLDYGFMSHPFLPDEHHVSLSVWWGPEEEVQVAEPEKKARHAGKKKPKTKGAGPAQKVNLNSASLDDLLTLPGIGKTTAQNILDFRKTNGLFKEEVDLLKIPRFQRRIFIRIRPYIVVGEAAPAVAPSTAPVAAPVLVPAPPADEGLNDSDQPDEPEEPASVAPSTAPAIAPPAAPPPAKATEPGGEAPAVPTVPAALPAVPPAVPVVPTAPPVPPAPAAPAKPAVAGGLSINSATAAQLERAGFTSVQAKNIVRFRQRNGAFLSIDELRKVPGVNGRKLEAVRDRLSAE